MAKELVHPSQQTPDRLVHQQRKSELKECVKIIHEHGGPYTQHRDIIRDQLWKVFSHHLYLEEHDSFKDWFSAQQFAFSQRTAQRMIADSRPPKEEDPNRVGSRRARQAQLPNGDGDGDGDGLKDSTGADIPKNLRATFGEWRKFYDHYAKLRDDLIKDYSATRLKSILRHFTVVNTQRILQGNEQLEHWLDDILDHLQAGRPWAVHQPCAGKGCRGCMSRGYLTRAEHQQEKPCA